VELVLESTRRFVSRDLAGLAALYTPGATGQAPEGWPEPGPWEGHEAVMGQYATLLEDWEDHTVEPQKSASKGDWVVIEWLWRSRGVASGVPVEMIISAIYRIEGTKIATVRFFWTWPEALEAAGLSE
jgi:ketosteroid isomerase-like protein